MATNEDLKEETTQAKKKTSTAKTSAAKSTGRKTASKSTTKSTTKSTAKSTTTRSRAKGTTAKAKAAAENEKKMEAEETVATEETVEVNEKKGKKDKNEILIEELNDKITRNLAEFDNYRKRTEREKDQMFEVGAKSIIEKILPVIDNFERGMATIPEGEKDGSFAKGMEMIYKQLMTSLEEAGVKAIEAEGKEFDPNLHNAVMHEDDDSMGDNMVSQELQKGYLYRDSVVRHSMVKVVN